MSEEIQAAPEGEQITEETVEQLEQSNQESQEESQEESQKESQEESQEAQPSEREEMKEAIEDAIEQGASEKQIKNMIKKFQLKVDGKVIDREVDLNDTEYLKNQLQLAEAARQRMSETAQMRKLLGEVENTLKTNPWEIFEKLGMDPDELAEMRLQQKVEQMKKSPEQLEREKINKELEELRQESKRLKEEKEQAEFQKMQQNASIQIETEIASALDAHKTLPKSRHVVKRIADSMLWAIDNGFKDVSAEDVIPLVERDLRDELNRFMDEMPDELLESYIGKKTTDRLRTKRLNNMKVSNLNQVKPTTKSIDKKKEKSSKKLRQKDFFRNLGK